jgi:exosortase/archaeosortase family protein
MMAKSLRWEHLGLVLILVLAPIFTWPELKAMGMVWMGPSGQDHLLAFGMALLLLLGVLVRDLPRTGSWRGIGVGLAVLSIGFWLDATSLIQAAVLCLMALALLNLCRRGDEYFRWGVTGAMILAVPWSALIERWTLGELQKYSTAVVAYVLALLGIPVEAAGNQFILQDHLLTVTQACDGMRLIIPVVAITLCVGIWRRVPRRNLLVMLVVGTVLATLANFVRLGFLVLVALWYEPGVQVAHDWAGWVLMTGAGVMSCWWVAKMRTTKPFLPEMTHLAQLNTAWRWALWACGAVALIGVLWRGPLLKPKPITMPTIPYRLDTWYGEDVPVPPAVKNLIPGSQIIGRQYTKIASEQIVTASMTLIGVSNAGNLAGHYPEWCLQAQGWEVLSTEARALPDEPAMGKIYTFRDPKLGTQHILAEWLINPSGRTEDQRSSWGTHKSQAAWLVHVVAQDEDTATTLADLLLLQTKVVAPRPEAAP